MNASLIIIGTEITRGLVQDTHTKNITFLLSTLGIDTKSVFTIPDSKDIQQYIKLALQESDIIITTGGLGPTNDDMTRFEISKALSILLVENKIAKEHISTILKKEVDDKSNLSQALIPENFSTIKNENGTALGFYGKKDGKLIISLPGPPFELSPMLKDVRGILEKEFSKNENTVFTYTLFCITEAHFNELTNIILQRHSYSDSDIIVGTCYKEFRVLVYLYTDSKDIRDIFVDEMRILLKDVDENVDFLFDGDVDIFECFAQKLIKNNLTISIAESITGGLLSKKLTDIPGSSAYFSSSIVSYSDIVKIRELKVRRKTIKSDTAVSRKCAFEMAKGALKKFKSDISISLTGYAGPTGENIGEFFIGICVKKQINVFEHNIKRSSRIAVRNTAALLAILHTMKLLDEK